ncbi:MAG: hypothetical protein K2L82_11325 [Lachnospiraceae bacterium]|nr:hypothetical protein [Lachnospiraceae bacterium]
MITAVSAAGEEFYISVVAYGVFGVTVLSGMSNVEQMKDNLSYMKTFNGLTNNQRETLRMAQEDQVPLRR